MNRLANGLIIIFIVWGILQTSLIIYYINKPPDKVIHTEIGQLEEDSKVELQAVTPENVKIYRITTKKTIVPIFIAVDKEGKVTNLR